MWIFIFALTPNEFDIVHILSSNKGKVFTRELFFIEVYEYIFIKSTHLLCIMLIR
ncbi:MAG: winged helix-turn-helix domain-containing protein [Clostridium sp.]|uniref:winged helix-turn-helix domain-containing protein n=1 Tax=Clostridium sp. TaxID=1506 RepID=UPI003D6D814F